METWHWRTDAGFFGYTVMQVMRRSASSPPVSPYQQAVGSDIQVAPASSRRLLRDSSFSRARKFPVSNLSTLILVAGHSVYTGLDYHDAQGSSSWYLLDYQKEVCIFCWSF